MKPAPFDYYRPPTLHEALEALASTPDAKVLAGGQSLLPLLSMRLTAPALLVDINGLAELDYVRAGDQGLRVGALARHADVEADPDARRVQPLVPRALRLVAHATIRNRGTTVGSIVHADAAGEMPVVLALLDGSVSVASTSGRRDIAAADLYRGPMESSLRPDELALEAFFPALVPGAGVACDEVARRQGDYALCGVAAVVTLAGGPDSGPGGGQDEVVQARAGYLSVADVPTVVDLTPALAAGLTPAALEDAADLALSRLEPGDDIHASAAYRAQLARVLTKRVVTAARDDALERLARSGAA